MQTYCLQIKRYSCACLFVFWLIGSSASPIKTFWHCISVDIILCCTEKCVNNYSEKKKFIGEVILRDGAFLLKDIPWVDVLMMVVESAVFYMFTMWLWWHKEYIISYRIIFILTTHLCMEASAFIVSLPIYLGFSFTLSPFCTTIADTSFVLWKQDLNMLF